MGSGERPEEVPGALLFMTLLEGMPLLGPKVAQKPRGVAIPPGPPKRLCLTGGGEAEALRCRPGSFLCVWIVVWEFLGGLVGGGGFFVWGLRGRTGGEIWRWVGVYASACAFGV